MNRTKLIWIAMAVFSLGTMVMQQVKIVKQAQSIQILETMVNSQNAQVSSQHQSINQLQDQNISLQSQVNSCEEAMIQQKFNR